jgi:hypothetical protein
MAGYPITTSSNVYNNGSTYGYLNQNINYDYIVNLRNSKINSSKTINVVKNDIFIDIENRTFVILSDIDSTYKAKVYNIKSLKIETEVTEVYKYEKNKNQKKKLLIEKYIKKPFLDYKIEFIFPGVYTTEIDINSITTISTTITNSDWISAGNSYYTNYYSGNFNIDFFNQRFYNGFSSCSIDSRVNNCYLSFKNNIAYVYDGEDWIEHKILSFKIETVKENGLSIVLESN